MKKISSPFWKSHLDDLRHVKTFEDASIIPVDVLRGMPLLKNKPLTELCGPISSGGYNNYEKNMLFFKECISFASELGFYMFDQTPLELGFIPLKREWEEKNPGQYCWPILNVVYEAIFTSGYIKQGLFLPNWESSIGSRWERKRMEELGIQIIDFSPRLFELVKKQFEKKYKEVA